ncbi:10151_t:CDS:10 [Paraglomus brasilianum]|uniref:10151_t:CDS:1 n=1 Tax=Paraglomus brasilianum TaxID=144538 RepID=A0A9N8ZJS5_9GLOM|nr:10151_t:CDS:10 [Paraglomus brasilianum]
MDLEVSSSRAESQPSDQPKPPEQQAQNTHDSVRSQLESLFRQHDQDGSGRISCQDLFNTVTVWESKQPKRLLNDEASNMFQQFCTQNPEMEVSVEDVMRLIDGLRPTTVTGPSTSVSTNNDLATPQQSPVPDRARTTPITKFGKVRSGWARTPYNSSANRNSGITSPDHVLSDEDSMAGNESYTSPSGSGPLGRRRRPFGGRNISGMGAGYPRPIDPDEFESGTLESRGEYIDGLPVLLEPGDDPAEQLSRLHRHTVELAKRLKESERHLTNVARQHEERIEELQHKLEETKADLQNKKREIQDHKSKEKTNLHQISALEIEIQKIHKNLNGQKQLYNQLKRQYEEQSEEAEKLRDLVRVKEGELANTTKNLSNFTAGEKKWIEERQRLESALAKLEADVALAQQSEVELEQQRTENSVLKETIDKLKLDLDEIRSGKIVDPSMSSLALELEANDHTTLEDEMLQRPKSSRRRKDNVSDQTAVSTDGADEELTNVRQSELEQYRHPVDEHSNRKRESRSLRRQAEGNGIRLRDRDVAHNFEALTQELGHQYALIENMIKDHNRPLERRDRRSIEGESTDLTKHSRLSRTSTRTRRRRTPANVEAEPEKAESVVTAASSRALVTRGNMSIAQYNSMVNNTVTFALYTLVVYLFGIITSVFVLDSSQGPIPYADWIPLDMPNDSWTARSLEIILYWLETLLNDGNNMKVPT